MLLEECMSISDVTADFIHWLSPYMWFLLLGLLIICVFLLLLVCILTPGGMVFVRGVLKFLQRLLSSYNSYRPRADYEENDRYERPGRRRRADYEENDRYERP